MAYGPRMSSTGHLEGNGSKVVNVRCDHCLREGSSRTLELHAFLALIGWEERDGELLCGKCLTRRGFAPFVSRLTD